MPTLPDYMRPTYRGFIALCDMCHHVKHIGYAGVLQARGSWIETTLLLL